MGRQDYDEIKQKYEAFVAVWKSKKVDQLDTIIDKEALCYISTVKAYACGSQHSLFGIKDFIYDMPALFIRLNAEKKTAHGGSAGAVTIWGS